MSNKWFERYERDFFKEYTEKELMDSLSNWHNGSGHLGEVVHHFFDRLMYKCKNTRHSSKKFGDATPMDALMDDNLVDAILGYIYGHPKMFWKNPKDAVLKRSSDTDFSKDDIDRMKLYFRMGGAPRKVSVFPPKNVKMLMDRLFNDHWFFDPPLNYHDPSCGFGTRAAAGLLKNFRYFGTDPNRELCGKIEEMIELIRKWGRQGGGRIPESDVRCQGSEQFIPEWEGLMDLSFTSPPYFNLEAYSDDSYASTQNYSSYEKWLERFLFPSIKNSMRYLKTGGYYCLNVKNIPGGKPLWDDAFSFVEAAENFEMLDPIDFVPESERKFLVKRKDGTKFVCGDTKDAHEQIMVARKKGNE